MKLRYALLCDSSIESVDRKLSLIGITDTLYARSFPAVHREGHFVICLDVEPSETGRKHEFEVQFINADGKVILGSKATVDCPVTTKTLNQRHILRDIPLPSEGQYRFTIFANGTAIAETPLHVVKPD